MMKMRERGQATILVLILVGLTGMFAVVWSVMRDQQLKISKFMDQKVSSDNLQRRLAIALADGSVCGCATAGLTFDSGATPGSQKITVPALRADCSGTSTIVAMENQSFTGGLRVRSIELAALEPEGVPPTTAWRGEWRVHWDTGGGPQIAPAKLAQRITISAPTGTVSIAACAPTGSGSAGGTIITSCPAGWVLVGPGGHLGNFCIDRNERPALPQHLAIANCAAFQPSTNGTAHLCNHSEWIAACLIAGTNIVGILGNAEWNTEFAGAFDRVVASGSATCQSTERRLRTDPAPFRCCYP